MKVAVILENTISIGGGFNQALNAILQLARLSEGQFKFELLTTRKENIAVLNTLGIQASVYKGSFIDKVIIAFSINPITNRILRSLKWLAPFEKRLIIDDFDLVYFTAPSPLVAALQKLNYILTVWDNCHRDFPEFPEVRECGEFDDREFTYAHMRQAYLTIVDSEELAHRLCQRYGVDRGRLLVMPFSPNPWLSSQIEKNTDAVLEYYQLKSGYLFYPAQFWAHKNHIRIVEALQILRNLGEFPTVVFVGSDHGNRDYVESTVNKAGVLNQVRFLGFVPNEHLSVLYEKCWAVLMPTYFGPTNIPPLEAWQAKRPLIYSVHLSSQTKDAALLIDPDDAKSIAEAILQLKDMAQVSRLIERGEARLKELQVEKNKAEELLVQEFVKFGKRRVTWL